MSKKFSATQMWTVALVLLFGFNIATTSAAPETPTRNAGNGNSTNTFVDDNAGLFLLCRTNTVSNNQIFKIPAAELPRLTSQSTCPPGESGLTFPSQLSYCPGCQFTIGFNFMSKSPGVHFARARFTSVSLFFKNFEGGNFASAIFSATNMNSAAFTSTNFNGATFESNTGNNLSLANFYGATLRKARLSNLTAINANFNFIDGYQISFYDSDLRNATFYEADLRHAYLLGADARNTNFYGADLSFFTGTYADFSDADFTGASLRNADMRGATLDDVLFVSADLSGVDFHTATGTPLSINGAVFYKTRCPDLYVATAPNTCAGHFLP